VPRLVRVVLAPVMAAAGMVAVPASVVAAGVGAVTAAGVVAGSVPARASSVSVLILSTSVNGGSSSAEATAAAALGYSVTVASASTWDAMNTSGFKNYSLLIIGDPSGSGSCASSVPSDALSTAGTWGPAVTGNVSVLGTAPALAGSTGATALMTDAIAYAASGSGTGLYVSLNCEYSAAAAGTSVPLLASLEGGGFTVQGESSSCTSVPGTVNAWQAGNITAFNGLTSASLSLSQWASPACAVQETFDAWPPSYNPLAIQVTGGGAASPAEVTASDGLSGQPYVLAGSNTAAPAAAAPATGGVPATGAVTGGAGNPAAPGLAASMAPAGDPVNPENGDFTQSATDVSMPGFGPSLEFTRTYDALLAQQQTRTGTPGAMGFGWTDNWATSVSASTPVPADIYTLDGMRLDTGKGGSALKAALNNPGSVYSSTSGDVYIAETTANEVSEIPAATGTQWGIPMTAGDIYTIAGSQYGAPGDSGNGTAATSALLNQPQGLTMDSAGNLYVADSGNNRVLEIPAATGGGMTADDIYTVAGNAGGSAGHSGDGGAATAAFLNDPVGLAFDTSSDLYVADAGNNRVQEVFASGGQTWGQTMSAGDIYTAAGSASGTSGTSPNGTALSSSRLNGPEGVTVSSGGDLYIADTQNNRIVEAAKSGGTQWNISMSADDIYTVAGSATGGSGRSSSGTLATSALLTTPTGVVAGNGTQLYVTDAGNNRIEEVARTSHTEWGIAMTKYDLYVIAGSSSAGFSGDGGPATSATLDAPLAVGLDGSFNLYIADYLNHRIREVTASNGDIATYAGTGATIPQEGDGGPAATAALYQPLSEAFDGLGDVLIADAGNNRVQEIAAASHTQFGISMTAGDVYTVAGNASGHAGISGDGGLARLAYLSGPEAVAVDAAGNLFIDDTGNNRIQEVSAGTGNISTVAGSASGTAGISGDGHAATSALLSSPQSVALDAAGDIYIADTDNNRIQKVYASGGQSWGQSMTAGDIYTIAGSATGSSGTSGDGRSATSALLSGPLGVAVDAAGNLYIADYANNRIQEVPLTTGAQRGQSMTRYDMYTIAGSASGSSGLTGDGHLATSGLFDGPTSVAVDLAGDVYISDGWNNLNEHCERPSLAGKIEKGFLEVEGVRPLRSERLRVTWLPRIGPYDGRGAEFSTGDADDDEVLRQIAHRSSLDSPRHWVHFLFCRDEASAKAVAALVAAAGWSTEIDYEADNADWRVSAAQLEIVLCADAVRRARTFFEDAATNVAGVFYDGWHASV